MPAPRRSAILQGDGIDSMLRLLRCCLLPALGLAQPVVNVGSKRFTESYILAEIMAQTVDAAGEARAMHRQGLGNTAILFAALKSGAIHVYPEYTGTLAFELLGLKRVPDLADAQPATGAARTRGGRAARIRQQLCPGDAGRARRRARHRTSFRPRAASRPEARAVPGIPQPQRTAGRRSRGLPASVRRGPRPRSWARVRGARRRAGGRHRRLCHRRQDRALPAASAGRRPAFLSGLRGGDALSPRFREAVSTLMGGACSGWRAASAPNK